MWKIKRSQKDNRGKSPLGVAHVFFLFFLRIVPVNLIGTLWHMLQVTLYAKVKSCEISEISRLCSICRGREKSVTTVKPYKAEAILV